MGLFDEKKYIYSWDFYYTKKSAFCQEQERFFYPKVQICEHLFSYVRISDRPPLQTHCRCAHLSRAFRAKKGQKTALFLHFCAFFASLDKWAHRQYTKQGDGRELTLAPVGRTAPTQSAGPRSAPTEPEHVIKLSFLITEDGAHGGRATCGDGAHRRGNASPSEGRSPSSRSYRQQDRAKPRRGGGSADSPQACLNLRKIGHLAKFSNFAKFIILRN